jgi:hypothetical protein
VIVLADGPAAGAGDGRRAIADSRRTRNRSARILSFDQSDVAGARALLRILRCEFHTLPLAEQLEHCTPHGTAMEEVLDTAFVSDESETLVDQ